MTNEEIENTLIRMANIHKDTAKVVERLALSNLRLMHEVQQLEQRLAEVEGRPHVIG